MCDSESTEREQWLQQSRLHLLDLAERCRESITERYAAGQTVTLDQTLQGRLSRIDAMQQQAQAQAAQRRAEQQLLKVQAALQRIDQQRYGRCRICEMPISRDRLRVDPCALLCLECAAEQESERSANLGRRR